MTNPMTTADAKALIAELRSHGTALYRPNHPTALLLWTAAAALEAPPNSRTEAMIERVARAGQELLCLAANGRPGKIADQVREWEEAITAMQAARPIDQQEALLCEHGRDAATHCDQCGGASNEAIAPVQDDDAEPDGSSFIWKWIERAMFDDMLSPEECLSTLAHYPNAPWNLGRWDVDHKPYASRFYKRFPKATNRLGNQP